MYSYLWAARCLPRRGLGLQVVTTASTQNTRKEWCTCSATALNPGTCWSSPLSSS
jgi:hypothetical protein